MSSDRITVDECSPAQTWDALSSDPTAQLVDVRTKPEWSFVGLPDLSELDREPILLEWRMFPHMGVNERFADMLLDHLGDAPPRQIFFICRSGARSMEAAHAVASAGMSRGLSLRCVNVAEGFEGDLNPDRHRGKHNGWKARGLAWKQN